jgi:hypothetical protein
MLQLIIPCEEGWDSKNNEFFIVKPQVTLQLEHSLVSLQKWESKWCKPFLSNAEKTDEEILDYIKCMTLTEDVDPDVYERLSVENIKAINAYINAPMTATTFSDDKTAKRNKEVVTAELIFYWMSALNIWYECRYWHINQLLTFIRVCNIKNQPKKKRSSRDINSQYAALNAARRKKLNSKG